MKDRYDIIVVGAGPAGSTTAKTAASRGLDVLMIEKRQQIGDPVRCAEGVNKEYIRNFVRPDPAWISAEVKGSRIYAPNGKMVEMGEELSGVEVGYVLERKVFDRALAMEAAHAGAQVMVKTRASGLLTNNGYVTGIIAQHMGKSYDIKCDIVIGADGVESKIGRWAGIDTTIKPGGLCSCMQYLITDIDVDPDFCEFYLGNGIAPTGYIWVFPKGKNEANVGIGISGFLPKNQTVNDLLDDFVKKKYPKGKIIELIYGGVPACGTIERTVSNGLILVGDAARQSDPLTGGGIFNSIWAGDMAGKVAVKAIKSSDVSAEFLQEYERKWRAEIGKNIDTSLIVKNRFLTLSDDDMNTLADSLENMDLKTVSLLGLVWTLFKTNKKLLWDLRSIFKDIKEIKGVDFDDIENID
ncbi:MAG: NAD(P)/FAD-dependent oxidoreductase [Methanosarcinales archaeon]|nr:NAD(P)/FAD-dependent oxidoreductase [Methanosarcinales archaeon]